MYNPLSRRCISWLLQVNHNVPLYTSFCCLPHDRPTAHSQTQFSTQCHLVLHLSPRSTLSFPQGHPIAPYVFFLVFKSLLSFPTTFRSITCFRRQFLCQMCPIHLVFPLFIVCRTFLSALARRKTSSFLTRSVLMIFSILLQHHISKLSRYLSSTLRSVQVSAPHKATLLMYVFTTFFPKFKTNFRLKRSFFSLNAAVVL